MEGKRTTALMVIMCLVILSLNVNPATAAQCDCCKSDQAKQLCSTCTSTGAPDIFCESACLPDCLPSDPVAATTEGGQH
uniref:Bowman-Birk serine protease inhibitors family domain-containing protein n=1 Tax=Setaria italica TaxID=4555 RepID=K3ZKQ3_SETIT